MVIKYTDWWPQVFKSYGRLKVGGGIFALFMDLRLQIPVFHGYKNIHIGGHRCSNHMEG